VHRSMCNVSSWNPMLASIADGAGARPDHPISEHLEPLEPNVQSNRFLALQHQCTINRGYGMDRGSIEQRHCAIFFRNEKHDLRAAKNDGLGALCD
jgi:hypothetical protein